jgi:Gamma-glutamyl cyclotransferase, AIG2-like
MTFPSQGGPERPAAGLVNLFVYGPLLFPEVLRVLLGRVPDGTPTALAGWRVAPLPGQLDPCLVPAEAVARGQLITGLTQHEWQALDAFVHRECDLRPVTLTDGRDAWAYVCPDPAAASSGEWDTEAFERDHFVDYLRHCAAWRQDHESGKDRR